jgi:hypothetical protein
MRSCAVRFFSWLALSLPGCTENITPPDKILGKCEGGATHAGEITTETWRRANNPHLVTADVDVLGTLTIEPGVVACFASDAGLTGRASALPGGKIIALGTLASPITFTAQSDAAWEGIRIGGDYGGRDTSVFKHVLVEHAQHGIQAWATVLVDSSRFRQITGIAISTNQYSAISKITNTVIDTAGSETVPAVYLGGGTFLDNTVRGARNVGILLRDGPTAVGGGRVEGSGGVGIVGSPGGFSAVGSIPIRITGGKRHPVEASLWLVGALWQGGELDSLRGNAADTIVLTSGAPHGEYRLSGELPWRVSLYEYTFGPTTLRLEPGAIITGSAIFPGPVIAEGTKSAPVRLAGNFTFVGANTTLRHVVVSGRIAAIHPPLTAPVLTVDSSRFSAGSSLYSNVRATIRHSVFETPRTVGTVQGFYSYTANAGVVLAGAGSSFSNSFIRGADAGLSIEAPQIRVDSSVFSGNPVTTIRTTVTEGVSITRSNFSGNGIAVMNLAASPLDARMNWWSSVAGPNTPQGERALGPVEFVPFSSEPFSISEP